MCDREIARWRFVSIEKARDGRDILTVDRITGVRPGRPAGWFRKAIPARPARVDRRRFIGEGVTWYTFPDFERAGFAWDDHLNAMWRRASYGATDAPAGLMAAAGVAPSGIVADCKSEDVRFKP